MTDPGGKSMTDLQLREATEHDIPALLNLYRETGIDHEITFTDQAARAHLATLKRYPYFKLFLAEVDQHIAGTYELIILDTMAKRGAKAGVVEAVAVHPRHQGRGIGRAMMQHAMDQCPQAGCYKLTLSSNLIRESAHRFYEALGFEPHGNSYLIKIAADRNQAVIETKTPAP